MPKPKIKLITRPLPHPSYGHYGGYKYGCKTVDGTGHLCPSAADRMDKVFLKHDKDSGKGDPLAEVKMVGRLFTEANPITTKFHRPVYGRLYWLGAVFLYGLPSIPFSTPIRAIGKVIKK